MCMVAAASVASRPLSIYSVPQFCGVEYAQEALMMLGQVNSYANSQPAEGRLRPKIIAEGRRIYFPTLLTRTPKLEALIQQYSSNTFSPKSEIGGSYTAV